MSKTPTLAWYVELAGIDYTTRRTVLGLTLSSEEPFPDRVWVWAYFVNPNFSPDGSFSDRPVEVEGPFERGSPAPVTVAADCHWCTNPDLPPSGYFARVNVSAVSAEDARIPVSHRRYDVEGATPVVVADAGAPTPGMVRHPELLSYAPALRKTAFDKASGRELGRVEDVAYDERESGNRALVYLVLYRGGIRRCPVKGTRLSEEPSRVADRVLPAAGRFEGLGSVEELERSRVVASRGFRRVGARRLADGELNYEYRSAERPGVLLEVSFKDSAVTAAGLLFGVRAELDAGDLELVSELLEVLRPGVDVGTDVLEYVRVAAGDELVREQPAPPYGFCDMLVQANTAEGLPIVSARVARAPGERSPEPAPARR